MMKLLYLYGKYMMMHIKSLMQFKVSFLLTSIGQFLVSFNIFLGVYFMFQRFQVVENFTYTEVILCFSIMLMAFTLAECFFRGFDTFSTMISNGEFDRILVRPKGIIFQVLASKMEFSRIGRLLQAIVMFWYGIVNAEIVWTFDKIIVVCMMIGAGIIVFASLFILYAGLCFFTLEGLEFLNIVTDGAREFGRYPVAVYGKAVTKFCTFIVPFALFQYYPFLYLIGKSSQAIYMVYPLFACLFIIPCYVVWRIGLYHYKSTGS